MNSRTNIHKHIQFPCNYLNKLIFISMQLAFLIESAKCLFGCFLWEMSFFVSVSLFAILRCLWKCWPIEIMEKCFEATDLGCLVFFALQRFLWGYLDPNSQGKLERDWWILGIIPGACWLRLLGNGYFLLVVGSNSRRNSIKVKKFLKDSCYEKKISLSKANNPASKSVQ